MPAAASIAQHANRSPTSSGLVRSEWRVGHEFYRQIQRTGGGLVSLPACCIFCEADKPASPILACASWLLAGLHKAVRGLVDACAQLLHIALNW